MEKIMACGRSRMLDRGGESRGIMRRTARGAERAGSFASASVEQGVEHFESLTI
jgi:hypothetical protein